MAQILLATVHALPGTVLAISKHSFSQHLLQQFIHKLRLQFQSTQHTYNGYTYSWFLSSSQHWSRTYRAEGRGKRRDEDQYVSRDILIPPGPTHHHYCRTLNWGQESACSRASWVLPKEHTSKSCYGGGLFQTKPSTSAPKSGHFTQQTAPASTWWLGLSYSHTSDLPLPLCLPESGQHSLCSQSLPSPPALVSASVYPVCAHFSRKGPGYMRARGATRV